MKTLENLKKLRILKKIEKFKKLKVNFFKFFLKGQVFYSLQIRAKIQIILFKLKPSK